MKSIHPQNFITIAFIVLEICTRQNLSMKKNKKKQKAITQGLRKQELRFMCSALHLDEIYPPTKFHNHSNYRFGDMHRTKVKFESKQRTITKKKKKSKQELWFMCTALPLDEIYPPTNFITIVSTVLEMCSGQNSSMKINKGQKLKNKATKSNSSYALHSPLMRSIHPQNLITIASIVLEICTGQKSSMKINKGQ